MISQAYDVLNCRMNIEVSRVKDCMYRSTMKLLKKSLFLLLLINILFLFYTNRISLKSGRRQAVNNVAKEKSSISKKPLRPPLMPLLYLISPTYARITQKVDLIRLMHTLRLVPRLHWIVIEDSANKTGLVTRLLQDCIIPHTHLNVKTPVGTELKKQLNITKLVRRGALQRNAGLDWIMQKAESPGVIYFADDDNTYDLQIFEEMRFTKKISVWPVGHVGGARYESPAIKNGTVVDWIVGYLPNRSFAIDMAGFAINTEFYRKSGQPRFDFSTRKLLEIYLLERMKITKADLEPKADNCTKVLVWHTKTKTPIFTNDRIRESLRKKYSAKNMEV